MKSSFLKKVEGEMTLTNKDSVYAVLGTADAFEEIVKELRFQANSAKRDPDKLAQELLDAVQVNLDRMDQLVSKLRKMVL